MDEPSEPPRPRRKPERRNPRQTVVRWNNEDYARLLADAERAGLKLGSYIRSRVLGAPTTRARKQAPVDYAALGAALRAFAKFAINFNQTTRRLNMGGFPVPEELAAAGRNIDASRMEIMAAMGRA